MKKLIIVVFILCVNISYGQDFEGYFSGSVDVNTPLTNKEWVGSTGLGLKFGYHRLFNEKFSLGGDFNWGVYNEYHPKETFEGASGTVTTDYYNYIYAYGLVVSGRYYLSYDHLFNPYLGVGLGAAHNKYGVYYNVYADQNKTFGFLARPEAGMIIRFSKNRAVSGLIGLHYDYSTARDKEYGYNNFSNLGINFGIVILDW